MNVVQAWTDESIYEGATGLCVVLVAVTLSAEADPDIIRGLLLDLVPLGARVLHWRDDRDSGQRHALLDLVNTVGIDVRATVAQPVVRRGQEAARARGLRRLLDELDRLGTTEHLIESRWPELDRRDRHVLNAARREGFDVIWRFVTSTSPPTRSCGLLTRPRASSPGSTPRRPAGRTSGSISSSRGQRRSTASDADAAQKDVSLGSNRSAVHPGFLHEGTPRAS